MNSPFSKICAEIHSSVETADEDRYNDPKHKYFCLHHTKEGWKWNAAEDFYLSRQNDDPVLMLDTPRDEFWTEWYLERKPREYVLHKKHPKNPKCNWGYRMYEKECRAANYWPGQT